MAEKLITLEKEYGNFYAPALSIEIDGKDGKSLGAEIAGVTVDNVIDGADQFSFSVNNPFNPASSTFKWSENGFFDVGKRIEIKMGYGSKMELMLLGLITSVKYSFPSGGASQMEIAGYDLSHLMMKGKKTGAWNDKKDSEVVTQIAGSYQLSTTNIEDSVVPHPKIKQDKESDYDFIKKLADRNGFEFFVFANAFYFRKPAKDKNPFVALQWGKTLSSFSPEINIAEQVTEVKVIGWNPATKKEIIGKASKGEEEKKGKGESGSEKAGKIYNDKVIEEIRKPVYTQAQADTMAKALLNTLSAGYVKGNGECIGLPFLKPGTTIQLEGLGKKFSKTYYIEKTTHSIGASGYKTTFSVKDNSI